MAGMKVIPLIASSEERAREDAIVTARTLVHGLRQSLDQRIDQLDRELAELRERVRRLEMGPPP